MESTSRTKLVIIGLILAAIVVAYFILSQRFQGGRTTSTTQNTVQQTAAPEVVGGRTSGAPSATPGVLGQNANPTSKNPAVRPTATARPLGQAQGANGNLQTLPRTGIPQVLLAIFSVSAMVSGWYLRKYPQ